jgi:hypothetical protein
MIERVSIYTSSLLPFTNSHRSWPNKGETWQSSVTNKQCCPSSAKVLDASDVLAFKFIPIPQHVHDNVRKAGPPASCFDMLLIDGSII